MTRTQALEVVAKAARKYSLRLIAMSHDDSELHRVLAEALAALKVAEPDGWRPIETAQRDANIIAKFWHAGQWHIVEAAPRGDGGWQDIRDGSCVGWMPNSPFQSKPGYWLRKAPPASPREEEAS